MRKIILMAALSLFGVAWLSTVSAVVDLRPRIDGSSFYSNADSLEFIGGAAHYDGYSDTVSVTGAEFISVDWIYTRNGAPASLEVVGNCYIRLEGSKDGVKFANTDSANDTIHITTAATTTTITFPYAPVYTYYRVYCNNDTLFSAITKWKVGGRTNAQ